MTTAVTGTDVASAEALLVLRLKELNAEKPTEKKLAAARLEGAGIALAHQAGHWDGIWWAMATRTTVENHYPIPADQTGARAYEAWKLGVITDLAARLARLRERDFRAATDPVEESHHG